MKFREKLKQLRTTLGLSQKQFAEVAGLSTTAIYYYECGRRIPRDQSIRKIISSFHISPKKFFTDLQIQEERQGRKVHMERDWLYSLYVEQGLTAAVIAQQRGCSKSAVLARLREFGIPRRPRFGHSGPQKVLTYPDVVEDLLSNSTEANEWLSQLVPNEAHVISRRLGIGGEPAMTLQAIGHELGVTRERIRQIQNSALDRLRQCMTVKEVATA